MEYHYPKFTPEMKKTHTILIPNMAVTQFRLMEYALRCEGYKCELLGNCGSAVAQLGLKYVHNDTCYPALLVIGQFLDALNSGKYDLEHTALLITQTGGGCRASNYIHLLRKALVKAGYPQIPVASLNFSGLEKDSGFQMTLPLARKCIACIFYGDMLCALRNQVAPYENEKGAADRMVDRWIARLGRALLAGKGFTSREMKHTFPLIAKEFATIPVTRVPKVKVGVVGEIYVKYSPLGNNDLQKFLESQDCEVNFPGLIQNPVSLETPVGEDGENNLGDMVEDKDATTPEDAMNQLVQKEEVQELLESLNDRERQVIRLRFGLEDGKTHTLEEIGDELNVTRERVRQIEARAMEKLRSKATKL